MKPYLLSTYILLFALKTNAQENPEEEKQRFLKQAEEIYQSIDTKNIVPFNAFYKGYVGFYKYRSKLNGSPLINFLNYSIPSDQERFVTIDFSKKRAVLFSRAAHGLNSSAGPEGGACRKVSSHRGLPSCNFISGVPAAAFSNINESMQSSLGFMIASEQNVSQKVFENLKLKGLEPDLNSMLFNRGVVLHTNGGGWSGLSEGCIVLPPAQFAVAYEMLKNNTLIYSFQGSSVRSEGAAAEDSEDITQAVQAKKTTTVSEAPEVTPKKMNNDFSETSLASAKPSLGSMALEGGELALGGVALLGSNSDSNKNVKSAVIPSKINGVETLKGSNKYQECQMLSDSSWKDTVTFINNGGNPSERFKGSWKEFQQYVGQNAIDPGPAMELAEQRVAAINDCVAVAHISGRTDFNKPDVNQPDKKSSSDGSITCIYNNPESQDYQACLKTIQAHDALLKAEAEAHSRQVKDYKTNAENRIGQVPGINAQAESLKQAEGLITDKSNVALERADISRAKIEQLAAVASTMPTTDSLYDECNEKFAKHGTVSLNEFNEIASVYSLTNKFTFKASRDYCLSAVSKNTNPVQNTAAREEVKQVLKKFGAELKDYVSKSENLLQQKMNIPSMADSQTGIELGGIGLNLNQQKMNAQDGSILLRKDDTNSSGTSASSGISSLAGGTGYLATQYTGTPPESIAATIARNRAKGFGGSDFDLNTKTANQVGIDSRSGIYNDNFYIKINLALKNPEQLDDLKLSPEQMKEYLTQKAYFDSFKRAPANTLSDSQTEASRRAKDKNGMINFPNEIPIQFKDLNLFEIISNRYKQLYRKN